MPSRRVPVAFNWNDYFVLAEELFNKSDSTNLSEAYLRTSISRAYYAVFCKARNHLRDNEKKTPPKTDVHTWVITQFKSETNRDRQKIFEELKRIKFNRIKADYYDVVIRIDDLATGVLEKVQEVTEKINNLE